MKKNILWAPWRMEYVSSSNKAKNIFLEKENSKDDRDNLVFFCLHSLNHYTSGQPGLGVFLFNLSLYKIIAFFLRFEG